MLMLLLRLLVLLPVLVMCSRTDDEECSNMCTYAGGIPGTVNFRYGFPDPLHGESQYGNIKPLGAYYIPIDAFYSVDNRRLWFNTTEQCCRYTRRHFNIMCDLMSQKPTSDYFITRDLQVTLFCPFLWKRIKVDRPPEISLGTHCLRNHRVYRLKYENCFLDWEDIVNFAAFFNPEELIITRLPIGKKTDLPGSHLKISRILKIELSQQKEFKPDSFMISYSDADENNEFRYPKKGESRTEIPVYDNCADCDRKQFVGNTTIVIETFPWQVFRNLAIIEFQGYNFSTILPNSFIHLSGAAVYRFERCHLYHAPMIKANPMTIAYVHMTQWFKREEINPATHLFQRQSLLSEMVYYDREAVQKSSSIPIEYNQVNVSMQTLLMLDNNNISILEGNFANIRHLFLFGNTFNKNTVHTLKRARYVNTLDLRNNPLEDIPRDAFIDLENLTVLHLAFCNISSAQDLLWPKDSRLKYLSLRSNKISNLDTCRFIQALPNLVTLVLLDNLLTLNFTCSIPVHGSLRVLHFKGNYLINFPAAVLSKTFSQLTVVDFTANMITTQGLRYLINANSSEFHSQSTRHIGLEYNCIEFIPLTSREEAKHLDAILSNNRLYLYGNKFHCNCQEMLQWLQGLGVTNIHNLICERNKKRASYIHKEREAYYSDVVSKNCAFLQDKYTKPLYYPYICKSDEHWRSIAFPIFIATMTVILITIVTIITYKRFYWIKQMFYVHNCLPRSVFTKSKIADGYTFDAIVCHGYQDSSFVLGTLQENIERVRGYKLGLMDRDSIVGEDIGLNIMGMMQKSRMAIVVLSESFSSSEWCCFSINAAMEEEILRQEPFYTISVINGTFDMKTLSTAQKTHLQRRPLLSTTEKFLWKKLEFNLGIYNQVIDTHDQDQETSLC